MSRRRKFAGGVAAMAMAFGGVVFTGGPASASGCTWAPCGRAVNDTASDKMRYTLKLDTGGDHRCNVWNFPGGQRTVSCQQQDLNPGKSVGGWLWDKKDVDAFTFPDTGYHVAFYNGAQTYHIRGMWTKISSSDTVRCFDTSAYKTPYCHVALAP